tara:strand:+ start:493 stop:639 length:147 start_codon:yes stop_codon:yes gene_type:complete
MEGSKVAFASEMLLFQAAKKPLHHSFLAIGVVCWPRIRCFDSQSVGMA